MLGFNRESKEAPHRWERQAGSCCHGPYFAATGGLLWGSLPKAKGSANAKIQMKHSYRLTVISRVQMMWTGRILSLPDKEKTCETWTCTESIGQTCTSWRQQSWPCRRKLPCRSNEVSSGLEEGQLPGSHYGQCGGWRGMGTDRETDCFVYCFRAPLPWMQSCKPSPFHGPVSCLCIFNFVPGVAQSYPVSGLGPHESTREHLMCCAFAFSEMDMWTSKKDCLAIVMTSCALFHTSP